MMLSALSGSNPVTDRRAKRSDHDPLFSQPDTTGGLHRTAGRPFSILDRPQRMMRHEDQQSGVSKLPSK
jgi:hypothetical protein